MVGTIIRQLRYCSLVKLIFDTGSSFGTKKPGCKLENFNIRFLVPVKFYVRQNLYPYITTRYATYRLGSINDPHAPSFVHALKRGLLSIP